MDILDSLVEFSNLYGKDPELVLAGGGNTSAKCGNIMYVKASGTSLSTIDKNGFVRIRLDRLGSIFEKDYPPDDDLREAEVLKDLMNSRAEGETKRPSVETTLHALFPQKYVLHIHPALVNGLTCSKGGEEAARKILPMNFLWIEACKPGYILAVICKDKMHEYKASSGKDADILLLQNHGIFIAGESLEELDAKLTEVLNSLRNSLASSPDMGDAPASREMTEFIKGLSEYGFVLDSGVKEASTYIVSYEKALPMMKPFTPDHIVYCKAYPLFAGINDNPATLIEDYRSKYGFLPRVIIAEGKGIAVRGDNEEMAKNVLSLLRDSIKIASYSKSFGGALPMSDELTDFIVNWEVENYRSKVSGK